jgi:hypothetical protein
MLAFLSIRGPCCAGRDGDREPMEDVVRIAILLVLLAACGGPPPPTLCDPANVCPGALGVTPVQHMGASSFECVCCASAVVTLPFDPALMPGGTCSDELAWFEAWRSRWCDTDGGG